MITQVDAHKAAYRALLHVDDLIITIRNDPDPARRVNRQDAALTMLDQALSASARPYLTAAQINALWDAWNDLINL